MTVETFKSWNTVMSIFKGCRPVFLPLTVTPAQRVKGQARRHARRAKSLESAEKKAALALPGSKK